MSEDAVRLTNATCEHWGRLGVIGVCPECVARFAEYATIQREQSEDLAYFVHRVRVLEDRLARVLRLVSPSDGEAVMVRPRGRVWSKGRAP